VTPQLAVAADRSGDPVEATAAATSPDWRLAAACRGHDPEMWSLSAGNRGQQYRAAHEICDSCPVTADCYDMAVRTGSWGLIYGGVDFDKPRHRMPLQLRKCWRCGNTYQPRVESSRYCSAQCRQRTWEYEQRWKRRARS